MERKAIKPILLAIKLTVLASVNKLYTRSIVYIYVDTIIFRNSCFNSQFSRDVPTQLMT